jgi:hypothetical protein
MDRQEREKAIAIVLLGRKRAKLDDQVFSKQRLMDLLKALSDKRHKECEGHELKR